MNIRLYQEQNKHHYNEIYYQNDFQRRQIKQFSNFGNKNVNINKAGHWSQKQNAKYYAFLQKFKDKFTQKLSRRQWKVFKSLAQFVKTRNANQCRSHHHKMQKNFRTIQQTLDYLKTKKPGIQKRCLKYAQQLNQIESRVFSEPQNQNFAQNGVNQNNVDRNQYIQQENFHSNFDFTKKNDIGIMKTTDCYEDQNGQVQNLNEVYRQPNFLNLPSTGIFTGNIEENRLAFDRPNLQYQPLAENNYEHFSYFGYPSQQSTYQQKLLQCHECFIKWFSKLKNLIQMEEAAKMQQESFQYDQFAYRFY